MAQAELSVRGARLTPWGNRIEIVGYDNVQFTKAPNVLRGMGLTHLSKNERALATFGNSFGLALYDRERAGVRKARTTLGCHA